MDQPRQITDWLLAISRIEQEVANG